MKSYLIMFYLIFLVLLIAQIANGNEIKLKGNRTLIQHGLESDGKKHSFWTKITNNLNTSSFLKINRPHENLIKLQKRPVSNELNNTAQPIIENNSDIVFTPNKIRNKQFKISKELSSTEERNFETTTTVSFGIHDLETKIMNDESFIGLKQFANKLISRMAKFFFGNKNDESRSYSVDEQTQHHWDDKDQSYHTSTFSTSEYEPTSFYHHYIPPSHYHPLQKRDNALLTKVAAIILIKLILAKLKAIKLLKLILFFIMKIPILFFKFLFILKSFKFLKLVSLPLIIASFTAPLLPLILLFAPLLLMPIFFGPLFLPLLLPLLFFLPLIPVTTPITATGMNKRKRRDIANNFNFLISQTAVDDKWKNNKNETKARLTEKRKIPVFHANKKEDFNDDYENFGKFNLYEGTEDSVNLLVLTRKMVESQHCMERIACEFASQNDSKVYQTAVIWALGKIHKLALPRVQRKVERYTEGYKTGVKWSSSDVCQNKFYCEKPKILLIQGNSKYKVF